MLEWWKKMGMDVRRRKETNIAIRYRWEAYRSSHILKETQMNAKDNTGTAITWELGQKLSVDHLTLIFTY